MAKGGCRFGAGRACMTPMVEHCWQLDVRRLHREDMLRPGLWGWYWSNAVTGKVLASIGIRGGVDCITLEYTDTADGRGIAKRVQIERTACNYGNSRPWFRCPLCDGRVALLYLRRNGFACRKCEHLAYRSQSEDAIGRTWLKQTKLERRLGENWERPKGMHRKTHDRLLRRIWDCEGCREDAVASYLARLGWPG